MDFLIRIIIICTICIVSFYFVKLLFRKLKFLNENQTGFLFWDKRIKFLPILMLAFFVYSWFDLLVIRYSSESIALALVILLISLWPIYILMRCINWRIQIKTDTFVYRDLFRKEYEFKYEDIKGVKSGTYGSYQILARDKKINIDVFTTNYMQFIIKLKSKNIKY